MLLKGADPIGVDETGAAIDGWQVCCAAESHISQRIEAADRGAR
jgi:hypothetical protein